MSKRGFTLIELLIVVAIIAILAAIAVPNFLEAQTRAKVSRTKADLRTYATAIEAYAVDYNKVPREFGSDGANDIYNGVAYPTIGGIPWAGAVNKPGLSTPVAYMTQAYMIDVFQDKNLNAPLDEQLFSYHDLKWKLDSGNFSSAFALAAIDFYGAWRMISVGPDRAYGHGFTNSAQLPYDSTNGTLSKGNLFRSQKSNDKIPPVGGTGFILTAH